MRGRTLYLIDFPFCFNGRTLYFIDFPFCFNKKKVGLINLFGHCKSLCARAREVVRFISSI